MASVVQLNSAEEDLFLEETVEWQLEGLNTWLPIRLSCLMKESQVTPYLDSQRPGIKSLKTDDVLSVFFN